MSRPKAAVPHILFLSLAFALFISQSAIAQVVQTDFEDGTNQGWIPRGSAVLTNSTAAANTGTHSLLATGRTANWNGPSIDLSSLTRGQLYIFKVAVRMAPGSGTDTVSMTMQSTIDGSQTFATVASGSANETGWTTLTGSFTAASNATGLLLYMEGASATSSYYVDTFSVTENNGGCANPPDNSGFSSSFEDNTSQGWLGRGSAAVAPTNADAHSGTYSLLVTGRTATWNGPTLPITGKMCNGSQYTVIAWVKMAPDQPDTQIRVSIQLTLAGSQSFRTVIGNTVVTSAGWTRLKIKPYTFSGAYDDLQIYVESNNNPNASFYIDDVSLEFMTPPVIEDLPPVKGAFADDFLIGFAAIQSDLSGPHAQLAALHHNSVTPGNDLKWDTVEPTEGTFNFTPGDNILNFAKANGIKMRGHTFVWHNQTPNWVFQNNGVDMSTQPFSEANKQLLLSRLKNHITTMINHYQGDIYVWDVVNEAIDESQPDGFRRSRWYTITTDPQNNPGYPEYMDAAFFYAREALDALGIGRDKAKLCYNDYNTTIPAKRQFIFNWVKGAIERGVPIDCVGHQFHNTINFPIDDAGSAASKQNVIDTINMFAGLGVVNEVTEFDVSLYRFGQCSQTFYTDYDDLIAGNQADLILEGYRYRDYFQIFKDLHEKIDSVTIWGLGDDESWLNPSSGKAGCGVTAADAPLLFDSGLQHKYAYTGVMNPLDLPGADLETTISANRGTVLSGGAVAYAITVTNHGHNDASNVVLSDVLPSGTVFKSLTAPPGWTCTTPAVGSTGTVTCSAATLTNGAAAQFTLVVRVACRTADDAAITNTASVASDTLDPNLAPNNSASVTVSVANPSPVISHLRATPSVLWPANDRMVDVFLSYWVIDNCDARIIPTVTIASSDSSKCKGHGNSCVDYHVVNARHVKLRAERSGNRDRVYTITLTATDSQGNSSSDATTVTVPHHPVHHHR